MRALVLFIRKRGDYEGVSVIYQKERKIIMRVLVLFIRKRGEYEGVSVIYQKERRL